jgi:hypothetical protein
MDFDTKYKLLMIKEKYLNEKEKALNDLENQIKHRESGLNHYYKDFIDSMQEKSFKPH